MANNRKKNLIVSYKNLPKEVQRLFVETYPEGYEDFLQRVVKPNGDAIYTVPLETDDTFYMVKFDVRVDSGMVEEDNDSYDNEEKGSDEVELTPLSEALDKEEGVSKESVGPLRHGGDYDEFLSEMAERNQKRKKKKHSDDDLDYDDEEDFDDDLEDDMDEEDFELDYDGPSDADLAEIDKMAADFLNDLSVPTVTGLLSESKATARKKISDLSAEPAKKKSRVAAKGKDTAAKKTTPKAATKRTGKKKNE